MNKMITQATKNMALFAACQSILLTSLPAEMISRGDRVVVIRESAVRVEKETVAVVNKGAELTADRVNGQWIWVSVRQNGKQVSGWLSSQNAVKHDQKYRLCRADTTLLGSNRYYYWPLGRGIPHVCQLESTQPVDLFIVSEEGKTAYEWAVSQLAGQATSKLTRKNVTRASVRWDPIDDRQYYLIVDNTRFPDGGAWGNRATKFRMIMWHDNLDPPGPLPNRGLIMGRVTLAFDGYEGRFERFSQAMTVCIAHTEEGEDNDQHQTFEVLTDKSGFFAVGNLPLERLYWVKEVKGPHFSAPIPFRISSPIRGKNEDSSRQTDVLDVGHFALQVNPKGAIGIELSSPEMEVTKKAGDSQSSLTFASTSKLDRHRWFVATFPTNGWVPKVKQDQLRIQRERAEAMKKKLASPPAPEMPADDA